MNIKSLRMKWVATVFTVILLTSCGSSGGGGTSSSMTSSGAVSQLPAANTTTNPTPLSINVSYNDTVGGYAANYYTFMTDSAGTYIISMTHAASGIEWLLFSDPNFLVHVVADCDVDSGGNAICSARNLDANAPYYLKVFNWNSAPRTYTLAITHGSSEGSVNTPIPLTIGTTPHAGGIDAWGISYYAFTTVAEGSFVISLADTTGSLMWGLYADAQFMNRLSNYTCNENLSIAGDISCAAPNLPPGTYYLRADNRSDAAPSYNITVAPDADGSYVGAPKQLALDGPQYTATIYDNGYNYYYFVAPKSGTYTMAAESAQINIGWELYSNAQFNSFIMKCDNTSGVGNETCMTPNVDKGTYFIKVYTNSFPPGQYTISVTAKGGSEGSVNEPVVLTPGAKYTGGRIASGTYGYPSYYVFTTGNSPSPFLFFLSPDPLDTYVYTELYADPGFSNAYLGTCTWPFRTFAGDYICATNDYYLPATLAANTTYYLKVRNGYGPTAPAVYSLFAAPLDKSLGCNTGGTCYNFEAGMPSSFVMSGIPWVVDTTTASSGTKSIRSGIKGKKTHSCFEFQATDVKWISYSAMMNTTATLPADDLWLYVDGMFGKELSGVRPWQRVIYIPPSGGTHTYKWCYEKWSTVTGDFAWVDDIELNY